MWTIKTRYTLIKFCRWSMGGCELSQLVGVGTSLVIDFNIINYYIFYMYLYFFNFKLRFILNWNFTIFFFSMLIVILRRRKKTKELHHRKNDLQLMSSMGSIFYTFQSLKVKSRDYNNKIWFHLNMLLK